MSLNGIKSAQLGAIGSNLNTLSNQSTQGLSSINWVNLSVDYQNSLNVKKYEVYEISQDLLALSVCWARIRKEREGSILSPTITKLLDSELFRLVSTEDIAHANIIRDYYSKKILLWKLKNINLTPFRQDLNEFIHGKGETFKEKMLPLVYRLPEFYEYDIEFEKMSFEYNKEVKHYDNQAAYDEKQLKFIKKLSVNSRSHKRKEYWFSDNNNNLINLNFDINNTLLSLLDNTLNKCNITVTGRYRKSFRDGNEFLKIDKNFTIK